MANCSLQQFRYSKATRGKDEYIPIQTQFVTLHFSDDRVKLHPPLNARGSSDLSPWRVAGLEGTRFLSRGPRHVANLRGPMSSLKPCFCLWGIHELCRPVDLSVVSRRFLRSGKIRSTDLVFLLAVPFLDSPLPFLLCIKYSRNCRYLLFRI